MGLPLTSGTYLALLAPSHGAHAVASAALGMLAGQVAVVLGCTAYAGLARRAGCLGSGLGALAAWSLSVLVMQRIAAGLAPDRASVLVLVAIQTVAVAWSLGVVVRARPRPAQVPSRVDHDAADAAHLTHPRHDLLMRAGIATLVVVGLLEGVVRGSCVATALAASSSSRSGPAEPHDPAQASPPAQPVPSRGARLRTRGSQAPASTHLGPGGALGRMTSPPRLPRRHFLGLGALVGAATLAGCGADLLPSAQAGSAASTSAVPPTSSGASSPASQSTSAFFDAAQLHSVHVTMDAAGFQSALAAWQSAGEKEWIEATVALDGTTYERVGARLKGNSTLRRTSTTAGAHEYPWLLRLDKYVDGQSHDGITELAVRVNNSASALNEAVALDLMGRAGLVTQRAAYAAMSVNDSDQVLRLVCEHPSDAWVARVFSGPGRLYKAEAGGNYSYRGTDETAYEDVFDQEAGDEDLAPLIAFLKWLNESSDADFAAQLPTHVDVDAFARYLAFENRVDNYDDIEGPGNNSYLWADADGRMTVVGWDHNLTFGVSNKPGAGGAGGGAGGGRGGRAQVNNGPGQAPAGNRQGNVLATRFTANQSYAAAVTAASTDLRAQLVTSGLGAQRLAAWAAVLTEYATDLVPAATIASDQKTIATYLTA